MNDFFSLERFYKYVKYQNIKNGRSAVLWIGGVLIFYSLIIFPTYFYFHLITSDYVYDRNIIIPHLLLGGIFILGFSLKKYSSKDSIVKDLLLPATVFEKVLYLFISKFLAYIGLFPFLYYYLVSISINIFNKLFSEMLKRSYEIISFNEFIKTLFFDERKFEIFHGASIMSNLITLGIGFLFIAAIIPFKIKFRVLSTSKFLIFITFFIFTYSMLVTKFQTEFGVTVFYYQPLAFLLLIILINILIWIYSYYLLKEKEV